MKILSASVIFLAISAVASAQSPYANQESGDIFQDIVRADQTNSSALIISPFNMGFVNSTTSPIINAVFQPFNFGTVASPSYDSDILVGLDFQQNNVVSSLIFLNFTTTPYSFNTLVPAQSVTMLAADSIPCIEAKIPKGTYTFQATATPTVGASTPGTFMFETYATGVWTVQFNLALPKAEGATRTLTFSHDTKVRWLLINNTGQTANAAITAKYYNSGG